MWVRFYIFPFIGSCATGIDFLQAQHINVFRNVHESKSPKPAPGHLSQRCETHAHKNLYINVHTKFVITKHSPDVLQQVND